MRKDASSACPCPGAPSRKRDRSNIGAAFCAAQPKPRPYGLRFGKAVRACASCRWARSEARRSPHCWRELRARESPVNVLVFPGWGNRGFRRLDNRGRGTAGLADSM